MDQKIWDLMMAKMKKKKVKDLTIGEIAKKCGKRRDCCSCPLIKVCGIVFGAYDNKMLNIEVEEL